MLGWVYREKGMHKEAFVEFQKEPPGVISFGHHGNAYARARKTAEAHKAIQKSCWSSRSKGSGLGKWRLSTRAWAKRTKPSSGWRGPSKPTTRGCVT